MTFGGYMYRLVGTNFGVEVKNRNQLLLEYAQQLYLHDVSFPTSAGGGASEGRRDSVFGAGVIDIERIGYACANQESQIIQQQQTGDILSMEQCIKKCRVLSVAPYYCRQTQYNSASQTCQFYSFSTNQIGVLNADVSCISMFDMLTFNVPEGRLRFSNRRFSSNLIFLSLSLSYILPCFDLCCFLSSLLSF